MGDSFLNSYSGESTAELLTMADHYRIDSLVLAFEQGLDAKVQESGLDSLTRSERYVLAVEGLEREVNNGGYSQFFLNSSNEHADVVVEALEQIGCPATAETTARAISALKAPALTPDAIFDVMDTDDPDRDALLEVCDDAYFSGNEPIADRLFDYIRDHSAEIRLPWRAL